MVFDGLLPSKTRCGTSQSGVPSAFTCSGVLPNASASVCAKHIGQQHVMMTPKRIQSLCKRQEVTRNQPRPLMDQLVEGVLSVGSRLSPVDWSSIVGHRPPA